MAQWHDDGDDDDDDDDDMMQWHSDMMIGWKWHRHSSAPIDKWSAAWGPAWINTRLQSHDVFFFQI